MGWRLTPDALELTFEDDGRPFDPLHDVADVEDEDDFSEGGMGVTLVRAMARDCRYERAGQSNRLTVVLDSENT